MNSNTPTYAVIMAGGSGTRFWPLSRRSSPKQVLSITDENSLLRNTVNRLRDLIPLEKLLIVTNRRQLRVIQPQLPEFGYENYLLEPTPRNTAPCIGLAAIHIRQLNPDGVMVVLPADHLIRDDEKFKDTILKGVEIALGKDALVTIGIPPSRPETGYGYIQVEDSEDPLPKGVSKVKAFAEKPNLATATRFVESGDFYWNSGIFIWKVSRILAEMEEHLPEQYYQLHLIEEAMKGDSGEAVLKRRFKLIRPISIDYGIMEVTSTPIYTIKGDFGWSDVGSWDEVYRISEKAKNDNVHVGETVSIDAHNNYLYSPDKLTAIIGLDDVLVINTKNATLICPRNRAQDVKKIVDILNNEGKKEYL